jgi:hypothetical protein
MSKVPIIDEPTKGFSEFLKEIENAKTKGDLMYLERLWKHLGQRIEERRRFL